MSAIPIRADGLGKKYHIGSGQVMQATLREQLAASLTAPIRRLGKIVRGRVESAAMLEESIWALRDFSFEVCSGETVGVIGPNGAGKSTLLKILTRITEPTEGYADLYGRVGSLLEVGTGFHPELTGRENTYLNGAILGMRRHDVDRKFDAIVSFSGLSKFIDTPIKYYSSGMYVRLAFAVAAHLEPEILLVDEVLSVGDLEFQRKCLGKMEDIASEGRTVVFVSHNLGLLQSLCQRGIFLAGGRMQVDGSIDQAVNSYLRSVEKSSTLDVASREDRDGKAEIRLEGLEVFDAHGKMNTYLISGQPARFEFRLSRTMPRMTVSFSLYDHIGRPVARFMSSMKGDDDVVDPRLGTRFICEVEHLYLLPGTYRLDVDIRGGGHLQDQLQAVVMIEVGEGLFQGRRMMAMKGVPFYIHHRWKTPVDRRRV